MVQEIVCYRCGSSLAELSLPLSRQDECPSCRNYLHVCRMCQHFDPTVPAQCREDDAEEVLDKDRLNFCDFFAPAGDAFDAKRAADESRSRAELDALFGIGADPAESEPSDSTSEAEKLFR